MEPPGAWQGSAFNMSKDEAEKQARLVPTSQYYGATCTPGWLRNMVLALSKAPKTAGEKPWDGGGLGDSGSSSHSTALGSPSVLIGTALRSGWVPPRADSALLGAQLLPRDFEKSSFARFAWRKSPELKGKFQPPKFLCDFFGKPRENKQNITFRTPPWEYSFVKTRQFVFYDQCWGWKQP